MTAANSPYGDLADDIALLATYGKVIRRHDGMYRLNGAIEKLTAAQVRGMAAELRNRRLAVRYAPAMKAGHEIASDRGPDDPRARMARHEITKTREGTPAGEGEGTLAMHADQAGIALAKPTCTKCGGPRSKWSKGHCAVCYAQAGRGSYPQRPTADVPDKFWRAVEPANEPTKSCGGRGVRTTEDNPAPHASRSQQGQATPDIAPSLPIEAGQECAAVGNVAKPETDTGRPPRSRYLFAKSANNYGASSRRQPRQRRRQPWRADTGAGGGTPRHPGDRPRCQAR